MSFLKKSNLDKLFKTIIQKSETITVIDSYSKRCDCISDLISFLTDHEFKEYFIINTSYLEKEIDKYKSEFHKKMQNNDYIHYRYSNQTEEEYIQEKLYSNYYGNHLQTFLLEKYKPTHNISGEVLLCELNLSYFAQSRIFFAIFFNDSSQLCFDYISTKGTMWRVNRVKTESDVKISSAITNLEAIKKLVHSFSEEEVHIKKEREIRKERNEKERVKKDKIKELSKKAVISKIKLMLTEKNISFFIDEQYHIFKIYLKMKKGKTLIRVPKKDIKTRLEILPSLCEKIIEADQLGIQCKYNQNM